ncbi:dihydrolipoamide acetyltransferase [Glaciecola sp. KUL10]|nr:dihydrolipoamide acetyltransferase [Glaciecola sp. KUL10]
MTEFILPDIGEGIVECELLEWLVKEGDVITEDQPVAEVMTDKATVQIPAMYSGVVKTLHYKEGDIAKVHEPLFAMDVDGTANQDFNDNNAVTDSVDEHESAAALETENSSKVEPFILPDIGEGIVECEIVKWCISAGDTVEEDQVVVEVMTDKAVVEIPAKFSGKVTKLFYQEGEIAKVHTPLFEQEIAGVASTNSNQTTTTSVNETKQSNSVSPQLNKQGGLFEAPVEISGKVLASPAVRRIARENNIDLSQVSGSGKKGRVLKHDLDSFINQQQSAVSDNRANHQSATNAKYTNADKASDEIQNTQQTQAENGTFKTVVLKGMRAAMAKQMVASTSTIPHFTVSDELCMDSLIDLRLRLKSDFADKGLKLSFMPFFIKSLSLALTEFEEINAQFDDESNTLKVFANHNIGLAVDSKVGLLVPNIKSVQNKSLLEVTQELNRIIDAAREGKLSSADLKGGTISISNIGALGGTIATPVINKPEVAIVALGKTQRLPRFNESGEVYASNIMTINWSGDHRVIDGATMVRFNNLWMSYLSSPEKMLVHLK